MMNLFRAMASHLMTLMAALILSASCSATAAADLPIYTDSLAAGWQDWSWSATNKLASTTPTHSGTRSIAVTITADWRALYLHAVAAINLGYERIQFWVHGGASGGQQLQFVANGSGVAFTPMASTWTLVSIPLATLGYPATLADLCQWLRHAHRRA